MRFYIKLILKYLYTSKQKQGILNSFSKDLQNEFEENVSHT